VGPVSVYVAAHGGVMLVNRFPLIVAVVLLLLPGLYVASYFALVKPSPLIVVTMTGQDPYRCGGAFSRKLFWPLEQIDRKVRPVAWESRLSIVDDNGHKIGP
jgi:hypothetical protein